jgi:hypothetical protein
VFSVDPNGRDESETPAGTTLTGVWVCLFVVLGKYGEFNKPSRIVRLGIRLSERALMRRSRSSCWLQSGRPTAPALRKQTLDTFIGCVVVLSSCRKVAIKAGTYQ